MKDFLAALDIAASNCGTYSGVWASSGSEPLVSISPADGVAIGSSSISTDKDYEAAVAVAEETFQRWKMVPAPERGELVRKIGVRLREKKTELGALVSYEMGKIRSEGEGEIQEVIDMAYFAVGLSRQLYGLAMHSERPFHRMYEQWHPLGVVGVVTAFNFPAAVWGWNAMLAAVCGNTVLWKPSEQTPLISIAMIKVCAEVAAEAGFPGLFTLVTDNDASLGKKLAADRRISLVSATGSCAMGRAVGIAVSERLGKSLLELGGNNAVVVLADADMELVRRATLFGAVGTAGQRCTTTRRLLVEKSAVERVTNELVSAYKNITIGNPLDDGVLMGPLVNERAVLAYEAAIARVPKEGGKVLCGGKRLPSMASALYVEPTIVAANADMPLVREETFAPILYIIPVDDLDHAIAINNSVSQGLSSAIFTNSVRSAEHFLSHLGSDCGIANVNIGTSGAEIGGAFGGEKDTGGGREAGSDSWKAYMRRQTCTINWGTDLPLAQGVKF